MRTAVILCAGRGTRLGSLTADRPKCLLEIGGQTLLEKAIRQFYNNGVQRFVLVVGYQWEKIREKITNLSGEFVLVQNQNYRTTNTLVSLWHAKEYMSKGFWLLNGDVMFDEEILSRFDFGGSKIGVVPGRCEEEEVKVIINNEGVVVQLSKIASPDKALGEFIGLAYFDEKFSRKLIECLEWWMKRENVNSQYFEAAVECAMKEIPLHIADLSGLSCIEIDTIEDYRRAVQMWEKV
ncbi:nucleotidyltransferase [Collibacillus ludicampi]|uniref:Nucleotidyltransferase n=1 Tax=Collibacillus ludicampi TaxID=2771369 RepID=A0AAV4LCX3_9BACL|nr:phosphocholine cytidylyltransferase family protein [Collibacillus ludicampi]GIM45665.1 nucleotidyltransferase [Collibacillus ludicampi]